jgi:hypothetical protein
LKYLAVQFNGLQARAIGTGFGESARRGRVTVRAIRYVENNPVKENKPPQRWTSVTPFEPSGTV